MAWTALISTAAKSFGKAAATKASSKAITKVAKGGLKKKEK